MTTAAIDEARLAAVFMNPNTAPAWALPVSRHTAQRFGCWRRMPAYASERNASDQPPLVVSIAAAMKTAAKAETEDAQRAASTPQAEATDQRSR